MRLIKPVSSPVGKPSEFFRGGRAKYERKKKPNVSIIVIVFKIVPNFLEGFYPIISYSLI